MIYIIVELILDPLENSIHKAIDHRMVGYVTDEEEARIICRASPEITGTGWPLKEGEKRRILTFYGLEAFDPKHVVHSSNWRLLDYSELSKLLAPRTVDCAQ
jgi:hypothetical protein